MNHKPYLASAILWAAAIIASAIIGTPAYFSYFLLPSLALSSLIATRPSARPAGCRL